MWAPVLLPTQVGARGCIELGTKHPVVPQKQLLKTKYICIYHNQEHAAFTSGSKPETFFSETSSPHINIWKMFL